MISKQKKILYGTVLAISSLLFANEVVNATQREPTPEPIERPAETDESFAPPVLAAAAAPDVDASSTDSAPSGSNSDPLAALESALARLAEGADAGEIGVEPSAPRSRGSRTSQPSATEEVAIPDGGVPPRETAIQRAERRARFEKLIEREPLVGIVSGPDGAVALVGGRSVRAGEVLGDGETRVIECTTAGLRVVFEGDEAWIMLPGLSSNARATDSSDGGAVSAPPTPLPRVQAAATDAAPHEGAALPSRGDQP